MDGQQDSIVELVQSICERLEAADAAARSGDMQLHENTADQLVELFREYERQVRLRARASVRPI